MRGFFSNRARKINNTVEEEIISYRKVWNRGGKHRGGRAEFFCRE